MSVTQADLDNIAAGLVSTEGSLQQAIARLEADIADGNDLDLSGVREAAAGLAALVPSETGGGEGPVASDPSSPVVDGSGSTDVPAEPAPADGDVLVDNGDQPA